MEPKRRRRWNGSGSHETRPAPGLASRSRSHSRQNMSQDQSNPGELDGKGNRIDGEQPDASGSTAGGEGGQVDWGLIREMYNVAARVIRLGKRWLRTNPDSIEPPGPIRDTPSAG